MKTRSVTRRNLVGGFWGGFLGILALGHLHPAALPLGCLLGVIVGWWHQEIWRSALDSMHRGVAKTQAIWSNLTKFILTPPFQLKKVQINVGFLLTLFHFLLFPAVWLLRRPIVCLRWLGAHPVNRAIVTGWLAALSSIGIAQLWIVPFLWWIKGWMENSSKDNPLPLVFILEFFTLFIVAVFPPLVAAIEDARMDSLRNFYGIWERYAAEGPIGYFRRELMKYVGFQVSIILWIHGCVLWFAGMGGAFLLVVIVPICALIGAIQAIYAVSIKAGHWLCFGTTLAVTTIMAWSTYSHLSDPRVVWAIALLAGLASAVATEGLRRILVWFFMSNERARTVAVVDLAIQVWPRFQSFGRLTETLGNRFWNMLPVSSFY